MSYLLTVDVQSTSAVSDEELSAQLVNATESHSESYSSISPSGIATSVTPYTTILHTPESNHSNHAPSITDDFS